MVERFGGLDAALAKLDPIQKLPLEFVLGGTAIYIWALLATPFQAFTATNALVFTGGFVVLSLALTFIYDREQFTALNKIQPYSWIALGTFVFSLWVRVLPEANFVLGSVNDSALHTLFVYAIIQDKGIPQSIPIVAPVVLQFPQGLHVVLAYFTMISGMPSQFTVFYELAYFNATIVIAAYTFASIIISKKFGVMVELILFALSMYPIVIVWGAQIIPWGLTIFFATLALCTPFFSGGDSSNFKRKDLQTAIIPGLLLGYLGAVYTPLFVLMILMFFIWALLSRSDLKRRLLSVVSIVVISLPLIALWIYRIVFFSNFSTAYYYAQDYASNYQRALSSGLRWFPFKEMTTLSGMSNTVLAWVDWPLFSGWPGSEYLFTPLLIIGTGLVVLAVFSKSHLSLKPNFLNYVIAAFLTVIIWGVNSPAGFVYYVGGPFGIMVPELDKAAVLTGTFLLPFLAATPLYLVFSRPLKGKILKETNKKYFTIAVIAILIIANIVLTPFAVSWLVGNYNIYAVTSNSDYQLLTWMHTGISQNSVVLVNPYDAGQYVVSISNKTVVGEYTGINFISSAYQNLTILLANNVMNARTLSLIDSLNVTYIFVGSRSYQYGWSPDLFIDHCLTFRAVKEFGTSYLFEVISTNPEAVRTVCQFI